MANTIGPVILDLIGTELSVEEGEILQHPSVGGIILFSRNYHNSKQLADLCKAVRKIRKLPLLITVDHEGGRVQRFKNGFTLIPCMETLGKLYEKNIQQAKEFATVCGWMLAAELLAHGIDLSFTPVLDLNKVQNNAVGDRSFSKNHIVVIELALTLIKGMQEAGMAATGKHFPGHGSVSIDSHAAIPIDERTWELISNDDLIPFQQLIQSKIQAMMAAHVIFPKVDQYAVGFSKIWLQEVMRKQCQFEGMIFSDDLNMKGAASMGDYSQRAHKALEAGCDMVLICNNRPAAIDILDKLPHNHWVNTERFKSMQGKFSSSFSELQKTSQWKKYNSLLQQLTEYL